MSYIVCQVKSILQKMHEKKDFGAEKMKKLDSENKKIQDICTDMMFLQKKKKTKYQTNRPGSLLFSQLFNSPFKKVTVWIFFQS